MRQSRRRSSACSGCSLRRILRDARKRRAPQDEELLAAKWKVLILRACRIPMQQIPGLSFRGRLLAEPGIHRATRDSVRNGPRVPREEARPRGDGGFIGLCFRDYFSAALRDAAFFTRRLEGWAARSFSSPSFHPLSPRRRAQGLERLRNPRIRRPPLQGPSRDIPRRRHRFAEIREPALKNRGRRPWRR